MKANTLIDKLEAAEKKRPAAAPLAPIVVEADTPETPNEEHGMHHALIFQPSDQMKNMLTLIARDNPKLYNRIVGME